MPRLTEASRLERRDAIADAALRVFARRGVAHASTGDIIKELGGSAGGVYSHFASKAEMVRFIAERVLNAGLDAITAHPGGIATPTSILRATLTEMATSTPTALIVQLWGEATVDDEMRRVVLDTLERIEESLHAAVTPWAKTLPGDPDVRAKKAARVMRTITQGYIVQLAVTDARSADSYFDDLVALLGDS